MQVKLLLLSPHQAEYIARSLFAAENLGATIAMNLIHERNGLLLKVTDKKGEISVSYVPVAEANPAGYNELHPFALLALQTERYASAEAFCQAYQIFHRKAKPSTTSFNYKAPLCSQFQAKP